jgi:hypothetical protein
VTFFSNLRLSVGLAANCIDNSKAYVLSVDWHTANGWSALDTTTESLPSDFGWASSHSLEGLRQIRNQVFDILDADRDADQRVGEADLLAQLGGDARMRHASGVGD